GRFPDTRAVLGDAPRRRAVAADGPWRADLRALRRGQHRPGGADADRRLRGGDRLLLHGQRPARPRDRRRVGAAARAGPRLLVHLPAGRPDRRRDRDQHPRPRDPGLPQPATVRDGGPDPGRGQAVQLRQRHPPACPGRLHPRPDRLVVPVPDQERAADDGRRGGPAGGRERRDRGDPDPLRRGAGRVRPRRAGWRVPRDRRPVLLHQRHDPGSRLHRPGRRDLRQLDPGRDADRDAAVRRGAGHPDPGPGRRPADQHRPPARPPLPPDPDRDHRPAPPVDPAGRPGQARVV
ncbi:MAG: Unspecified monosaccharide ABC transport system, permease component 2, partial [uncultured Thermomicrobiales bacterium]